MIGLVIASRHVRRVALNDVKGDSARVCEDAGGSGYLSGSAYVSLGSASSLIFHSQYFLIVRS